MTGTRLIDHLGKLRGHLIAPIKSVATDWSLIMSSRIPCLALRFRKVEKKKALQGPKQQRKHPRVKPRPKENTFTVLVCVFFAHYFVLKLRRCMEGGG
jgi:hypothetical protein